MNYPKSILLATDFGRASELATEAVIHLGRTFDARVGLLHVLEPMLTSTVDSQYYTDLAQDRLREVSEEVGRHKVAVADVSVVKGSRAGEIFNKARELDANLVVVGAGKTSPLGRFSPGPVAETVLELASQPVLAVHPATPAPKFQKILCPVDHSPASGRGLHSAVYLSRACGSHLIVLSVVPEITWLSAAVKTGQMAGAADAHRRMWLEEYDLFLRSVDFAGVRWQKEVREGVPDREILGAAQEHQADLILMGSIGRTGLVRILMGSVTRHVLQDLPCALLIVKEKGFVDEPPGVDPHPPDSDSARSAPQRQP